jgi:hypothetical protein
MKIRTVALACTRRVDGMFGQGRKQQLGVHPAVGREETPRVPVLPQERRKLPQFGRSDTVATVGINQGPKTL